MNETSLRINKFGETCGENQETEKSKEMLILTRRIALNLVKHAIKIEHNLPAQLRTSVNLIKLQNNRSYTSQTNPQNLPHYPVLPLRETLEKFLKTTQPHLTAEEFKQTCDEVNKFLEGPGPKLQALLQEAARKSENWLAPRWLKSAYLQYRDPVCVFSSPGMTLPPQKFTSDDDFLKYAAKVTFGILKYKELFDQKKIPVEKMGEQELDMSQYTKVFGTCRIPGLKEDHLEYNADSQYIVVAFKGHWWRIPVYSNDCKLLHPDVIYKQLKAIFCSGKKKAEKPIGILTSNQRDAWGKAYCDLMSNPENKESVEHIQKALFALCLDDEVPVKFGENESIVISEQLIHGGGSAQNSGNRWFDKTIQLIINRNGVSGLCQEHSPAEGQPVARMTDFVIKNLKDDKFFADAAKSDTDKPCELAVCISDNMSGHFQNAKENVDKLAKDLEMYVLNYKGYGRELIKSQKMSPDSYLQMAMQYAFYRLHKVPAAQYESAHLRVYPGGRTETIRSCSNESLAFAKAMTEKRPDEERAKLLRDAVNGHSQYTRAALQGKGVDRHLLGLKLMAIENNLPIPDLYKTPGILKSAHFRMSTSQVASPYVSFMCYGPLTHDGYGCCYNPRKNDMFFAISSWRSNKETDSKKFARSMHESLDEMAEVLCRVGEKPKSKL